MSKVNEEFLDEVLGKMLGGGYPWANGKGKGFKYSDSEGFDITEDVEEAKQAILQHFQQEQESKTSKRLVEWTKHLKKGEELFGRVDWDAALYGLKRRDKWSAGEESKMYTQSEVDRLIREAKEELLDEMLEEANEVPHDEFYERALNWSSVKAFILSYYDRLPDESKHKEGSR